MRVLLDREPWRVRGFLGDEWRHHRVWGTLREPDAWLPASVPGSVVDDLWRANSVPDPYTGLNTRAIEWVSDRHWAYRHEFRLDPPPAGQQAFLCLDGVDHSAVVYLDGTELGRVDGMFVATRFDVTELVRTSAYHTLVVVVEPAPVSEPQVGHTAKVRAHKSRMTYGWDFCPRLVHQGIWQSVYVELTGPARITDLTVTADRVLVRASGNDLVELTLTDADGVVVASGDRALEVRDPRPWWPNGSGTPYLYHLTATAYSDGVVSDRREYEIGFRTVRFFRAEGAPDDAAPYGIEVNGRRIFAKGWNWVPLDLSYGVPRPDRLGHLLDLAVDAGVNLLRVWGGGLIETPEFYAECDRRGLLVWQEFSQSSSGISSTPADDEDFVAMMRSQAEAIVPRLRHHPSLAIWGGGNELQAGEGEPLNDAPVLTAVGDVVRRLDPGRLWLSTSPTGPAFLNRLDLIEQAPDDQHDVHGPWEHQGLRDHYALYDAGTAHLLSEFGVEGMTMPRSVAQAVPEPERRLPTRGRPVWDHLGRWWNNETLVQESFGNRIRDLDTLGLASQFLQRDGLQYATEAHRRRWPRCVGTLPWQFNEPYPNAWCTSAVTHAGEPKPAYFGVSAAYRSVLVGAVCSRQSWAGRAELRLPLWFLSEGPLPPATVTARLLTFNGAELTTLTCKDVSADAFADELRAATPTEPFVVDLQLVASDVRAERRYVLTGTDDFAELLDHRIEVDAELCGDQLRVRHLSGPVAPFVRVRDARPVQGDAGGWLRVSDSGFVLLPGEERMIDVRWCGAGGDRVIAIDGLGLHPRERLIRCS
ncbi:glycoside hydrolase family 2 protein [Kribbella shirazensis]|uniref:beta-mannosidase n=1 Tax=Kribbella shirazensis TaxID=1105143 RepID=A0A7X5ZYL8_9ACTN|nr:glycoside hydrolase family 2 TIM barrel-domain containing protein [Kribbella shirazensis]NIK54785.1 beta-mannosidase [Kribbella shirazensis]